MSSSNQEEVTTCDNCTKVLNPEDLQPGEHKGIEKCLGGYACSEECKPSTCSGDRFTCVEDCCATEDEECEDESEDRFLSLNDLFKFQAYFPANDSFVFGGEDGEITFVCDHPNRVYHGDREYIFYAPLSQGGIHHLLVEYTNDGITKHTVVKLEDVPKPLLDWFGVVNPVVLVQTPKRKREVQIPDAPKKKNRVEYAQAIQRFDGEPNVENLEKVQGLRLRLNAEPAAPAASATPAAPAASAAPIPAVDPNRGAKYLRRVWSHGLTVKILEAHVHGPKYADVPTTVALDGKKVYISGEQIGGKLLLEFFDPNGEFCNADRGDAHALMKHLRAIGANAAEELLMKGIQKWLAYMTKLGWTLETMGIQDYLLLRFMYQTVPWLLNNEDMDVKNKLIADTHAVFQAQHRELKALRDDPDGEVLDVY